jgi:hypothetical protein
MNTQNNIQLVTDNHKDKCLTPLEMIHYVNMVRIQAHFANKEIIKLDNMLKDVRNYLSNEEEIIKFETLFDDIFYCNKLDNIYTNIKWLEQEMEKLDD